MRSITTGSIASLLLPALASVVALAAPADGAIVSTSGQAVQIGAPASALYTALPGPPAYCWNEQSGISSAPIFVNTLGPGTFTGGAFGPVAYSGAYASHMIHFDASTGVAVVTGSVTFSAAIRAVIYDNSLLSATDASLGALGTAYDTSNPLRSNGPVLGTSSYTIVGNTINFTLWANGSAAWPNKMVELRVLTDAVPAPAACALLGLAGLAGRRARRR